jgi:hypothetical protein
MLTTRLEKFGRRERLTVAWQPSGTPAAESGQSGLRPADRSSGCGNDGSFGRKSIDEPNGTWFVPLPCAGDLALAVGALRLRR